jgi:hypothetical protein
VLLFFFFKEISVESQVAKKKKTGTEACSLDRGAAVGVRDKNNNNDQKKKQREKRRKRRGAVFCLLGLFKSKCAGYNHAVSSLERA